LGLGGGDKPTPRDYTRCWSSVRDRPDAHLIQTVMLRSLAQAVYNPAMPVISGWRWKPTPISPRRSAAIPICRCIAPFAILNGGKAADFPYTLRPIWSAWASIAR
jgi:ribonuclease R